MSDKKHIDRLFQERFKDFEANPDPNVWNDIQSSLNANKKRRRVIPLWWKISGVAALLILSFTIGNFIYNSNSNSDNPKEILVESENSTPKDLELDSNNSDNSTNKNNTVTSSTDDLKLLEEITSEQPASKQPVTSKGNVISTPEPDSDIPLWASAPQFTEEQRASEKRTSFTTTVVRITKNKAGKHKFYTEDGAIWEQTQKVRVRPPRSLPANVEFALKRTGNPTIKFVDVSSRTYRVRRIK